MLAAIGELEPRFRKSGQQQLLLETLLVRFALLDRTVAIEDVLRGMGDGGGTSSGSRPTSPSSSASRVSSGYGTGGDAARRSAGAAEASLVSDRQVSPPVVRDQGARPRAEQASRSPTASTRTPAEARPAFTPSPPAARAAPPTHGVPSINVITERWDEVVTALGSTRMLLAPFLEQAVPSAISAAGVLTVRADDEASADALEMAKADMLSVVKSLFPAVDRVAIARPSGPTVSGTHRRVTEAEIREQRIASLRKRDPVLGAAIDALDLELLD
jgi:DNA polymerase-3 subunit gamma/tau